MLRTVVGVNGGFATAVQHEVRPDPALDAAPSEADRDHIACCRDFFLDGPLVALCGFIGGDDRIPFSDHVCQECATIAMARLRELGVPDLPDAGDELEWLGICVRDGSPCPTGDEADSLYGRIVGLD